MKIAILIILACITGLSVKSQTQFIKSGKITYERKLNMWASMPPEFADQFKKSVPQFKTDLFILDFDQNQSLYSPTGEQKKSFFDVVATDNVVFSNFKTDSYIGSKNVFEKTFLISDSMPKYNWKIKDDFREIAGFNCRRATTVIFDSVFVVAFYTDEIVPSGGPESFHGLPGTILGLVINRLHSTWYATKVEVDDNNVKKLTPPTKGTKVNFAELQKQIQSSLKQMGGQAQQIQWTILI